MNNELVNLDPFFNHTSNIDISQNNNLDISLNKKSKESTCKKRLESSEFKRVHTTVNSTIQNMTMESEVFYVEKFEYYLIKIEEFIEDFKNFFIDIELERIEKEEILKKKYIRYFNLSKMTEKSSYQFNKEIKSNLYNRSVSPQKRNFNKLALSFDSLLKNDFRGFEPRSPNQFYIKFLKTNKLLNLVELKIIKRIYLDSIKRITSPAKVMLGIKLNKFIKFNVFDKNIFELINEKNNLYEKLKEKQIEKLPLFKHIEEIYNLEKEYNHKKAVLINRIEKYKFILEMKLGTNC